MSESATTTLAQCAGHHVNERRTRSDAGTPIEKRTEFIVQAPIRVEPRSHDEHTERLGAAHKLDFASGVCLCAIIIATFLISSSLRSIMGDGLLARGFEGR